MTMFRKVAKVNATQLGSKQQTMKIHQLNNTTASNFMLKETFQALFLYAWVDRTVTILIDDFDHGRIYLLNLQLSHFRLTVSQ